MVMSVEDCEPGPFHFSLAPLIPGETGYSGKVQVLQSIDTC